MMLLVDNRKYFFCLCVSVCLAACAPKQEIRKRYFWPPLTDNPKMEYVGYFQSDYDVVKPSISSFSEAVFGRAIPRPIFSQPYEVYSDGDGRLYVSEPVEGVVNVFDIKRGSIDILKNKKGNVQLFEGPYGLTGDNEGRIFVVASAEKTLFVFGADGKLETKWNLPDIKRPLNVAVDDERGLVYLASPDDHKVFVLSLQTGETLRAIGTRGVQEGEFNFPVDVDVGAEGELYVLDSLNARVQVFDAEGRFVRAFGERGTALGSFQLPKGIAYGPPGVVYVTDSMAHKVILFDRNGEHLLTIGGQASVAAGSVSPGGFYLPLGIDADSSGAVWVVDALNKMVQHFQYLHDDFLKQNPILPGQAVVPNVFMENQ